MLTVTRTAVPVVVAGLLLTACGAGKDRPAPLDTAPIGASVIGAPEPMGAGASMGTAKPMGSAGGDAAAPVAVTGQMAAAAPMAAAPASTPVTMDAHTITTRGVGKVSATPDTLVIMIGVSTQGSSAKAALADNNVKSNALLDLLRAKGIAAKDLQTRQLSINPTYTDKSTISGYQVDNMVQARSGDIAGAGALIDAAAGVVGNAVRVQHISFSVGEDSALRAQARSAAVNQAKAQAAQLAKAAGVTLGRIRSVTELADAGHPISYDMRSAAGAAESTPLQPGQQELTVSVDIVYDIG
ncbi:MAG TPA: SIMPL domain-containing protein [Jatrophihabitans sp.]|jgi:hypothetical protein|uniref:SIMPL domain-containing protein n=1 Tax=Jatrophihabitans sp. TaxID=1932789 RepID=UPI002EEA65FF